MSSRILLDFPSFLPSFPLCQDPAAKNRLFLLHTAPETQRGPGPQNGVRGPLLICFGAHASFRSTNGWAMPTEIP